MKAWMLVLLVASLISFHPVFAQDEDEVDLRPLLQKWINGEAVPSGIISLATSKKATESNAEEDANITFLDLNGDGLKEMAVQTSCAAVGNCGLDIYQKSGKTYRRLAKTDMVQTIKVLRSSSHGYRDLDFHTHGSATEGYHRIFRFSGKGYRQSRCWTESYSFIDKRGKMHVLKKPLIHRGCDQDF